MEETEFDKFAEEYRSIHASNIRASGESPEFFAEYKVKDVAAAMVRKPPATILDFGGGVGTSLPYFRQYFPNARLTCLDVSQRSLRIARERYVDLADFVYLAGEELPFPAESFEMAFAACVFHHIDPGERARWLQELNRVLQPGGRLFIFEHNPLNPLTVRAVNACPFDENAQLTGSRTLKHQLVQAGFQDTRVCFRIFFPRFLARLRGLEKYLTWLPLGAQYFVSGSKPQY